MIVTQRIDDIWHQKETRSKETKCSWIATFLIGVAWHFFCTLLESVDWSVVSRPRPSANYSIVAMVPKRWSIACKAANESIISFQWIHNGVNCIGRCKRQEQSRHSPLHRMVPTGIASWLTWRRTKSLQFLRLVSRQTNNLSRSNQEIDKISVLGQNPSMLDRGLLDFFSMIDIL